MFSVLKSMEERIILHIDMDAFYASVEQRDNPSLLGKPIVVGEDSLRSVVSTASYEARRYGISSAMPMVKAKKMCPNLIIVPHRFDVYKAVSAQIHGIFKQYTQQVEPISLDEAFLDIERRGFQLYFGLTYRQILGCRTKNCHRNAQNGHLYRS